MRRESASENCKEDFAFYGLVINFSDDIVDLQKGCKPDSESPRPSRLPLEALPWRPGELRRGCHSPLNGTPAFMGISLLLPCCLSSAQDPCRRPHGVSQHVSVPSSRLWWLLGLPCFS